jgi:hypothetical protein
VLQCTVALKYTVAARRQGINAGESPLVLSQSCLCTRSGTGLGGAGEGGPHPEQRPAERRQVLPRLPGGQGGQAGGQGAQDGSQGVALPSWSLEGEG